MNLKSHFPSLYMIYVMCSNISHYSLYIQACMIANIHPESADEVFSLVPSLKVRAPIFCLRHQIVVVVNWGLRVRACNVCMNVTIHQFT